MIKRGKMQRPCGEQNGGESAPEETADPDKRVIDRDFYKALPNAETKFGAERHAARPQNSVRFTGMFVDR